MFCSFPVKTSVGLVSFLLHFSFNKASSNWFFVKLLALISSSLMERRSPKLPFLDMARSSSEKLKCSRQDSKQLPVGQRRHDEETRLTECTRQRICSRRTNPRAPSDSARMTSLAVTVSKLDGSERHSLTCDFLRKIVEMSENPK